MRKYIHLQLSYFPPVHWNPLQIYRSWAFPHHWEIRKEAHWSNTN